MKTQYKLSDDCNGESPIKGETGDAKVQEAQKAVSKDAIAPEHVQTLVRLLHTFDFYGNISQTYSAGSIVNIKLEMVFKKNTLEKFIKALS